MIGARVHSLLLTYKPSLNAWVLTGASLRNETTLRRLGGRKLPTGAWKFPGVYLYASRILDAFPATVLTDEAVERMGAHGFPILDLHPYMTAERWEELYEYQQDAVRFLTSSPLHGSMLALSPGMGKCACAIVAARIMGVRDVLIVSPLSLLFTWKLECKAWGMYSAEIFRGYQEPTARWCITNYDTVVNNLDLYSRKWDLLILDESVLIKNRKTKRFSAITRLSSMASKVWELSGSPITRAVDDLYSQFKVLEPSAFPSYWRFAEFYCEIDDTVWGKQITASKQGIDFRKEFRDLMFTSDWENPSIPEILYETINLTMTPRQEDAYTEVERDLIVQLSTGNLNIPNRMAQITRLRQIVSNLCNIDEKHPASCKVDAIMEMLGMGAWKTPVLIWSPWRGTGEDLLGRLSCLHEYKARYIHGDTPHKEREEILWNYFMGRIDILILSLEVGKYGLNSLVKTRTAVYIDKTFSMEAYFQSVHRLKRIGLQESPVIVTLRCPSTIDELVEENLQEKSIDLSRISGVDLADLLQGLGRSRLLMQH